ncbi:hypothetical protein Dehly_0485 [Dehalogenimonas lykanthroporepellens BL-DC-9]|nr:hypothetical protein Dehly_0485 [Dehalogenimonas lykanthroporepellens BL-DC-9]
MQFKKRFLMVFMSLTLLAGMMGGGSVVAADEGKTQVVTLSNFDILFPMPADLEKAIVHDIPKTPVIIDGVLYQPEQISSFDGQRLHFTSGKDGKEYAFTTSESLEKFLVSEFGTGWKGPGEGYGILAEGNNVFFKDWYFGGGYVSYWSGTSVPNLGSFTNSISSMRLTNSVTLCDLVNYGGDTRMYVYGVYTSLFFDGWNDKASSLVTWSD